MFNNKNKQSHPLLPQGRGCSPSPVVAEALATSVPGMQAQDHPATDKSVAPLWHDVLKKHNGGKIPKKGTPEYDKVRAIYDELKQRGMNKRTMENNA